MPQWELCNGFVRRWKGLLPLRLVLKPPERYRCAMPWLILFLAITLEVLGTTALKMSEGFTRIGWGVTSMIFWAAALFLLSLVLKTIPVGIAYAIWAGFGVALVAFIGVVAFGQKLDWAGWLGMAMIVGGVILLNVVSRSGS